MIPAFPNFKKVEVRDRADVESFTHRYPPYSDFNFTSLWAWDTSGERMISTLNNNLVVRFTDYSTHEPFLSFLGTYDTERTARILIDYAKAEGITPELRLMPEISVRDMRASVLKVEEDRDNFDYIYSIPALATLSGRKFQTKRNLANRFWKDCPNAVFEMIDLDDAAAQEEILRVLQLWEKNKVAQSKEYELAHELDAIRRLCKTAASHTLLASGLFLDGRMIGFSIDEILPAPYTICHFWKADTKHRGSYDVIIQEKAKHFVTVDREVMNFEQDLGAKNMRFSKSAFRPVEFLKKYRISIA